MLPKELAGHPTAGALAGAHHEAIVTGKFDRNELTLEIVPDQIAAVCDFLKRDLDFIRLSSVTAVDRYPAQPRFEVVYHLHSLSRNERVRLKCRVDGERPEIDSVTSVWRGANWYERETFDLFGVVFRNHPNLTRIMMPDDWEGHPLRKDYPITGPRV